MGKERLCSKCGNVTSRNGYCSPCAKVYRLVRRGTAEGRAADMWNGMIKRAENRDGKHKRYADVRILWTRDAFIAWAIPRIESLWDRFPGESPSIDRINSYGNYEPSNCRIITWNYHRKLKNKRRDAFNAARAKLLGVKELPSLTRPDNNPPHTSITSVDEVTWYYQI